MFTNAVGRLRVFLTRPPPIRKSPARPPATAFNLPPNFTPQASDQARYMREARLRRRTASGANNYLSSLQDYAFTTFRRRPPTTTENRADNATHHDFYNFYNFDVNQVQHLGI